MAHRLTTELCRLFTVTQKNAFETGFPYHSEVERLSMILGMVGHHLPSFPRLECGYAPFQPENERAVLTVLDRLDSLIIPRERTRKVLYPHETDLVFPMNSGDQLHQISKDLASILLDERMIGYVQVALSRLRRMSTWIKSSYHSKSWKELDTIFRDDSPKTSLYEVLSAVAKKSGWQVSTIQKWIHLASTSHLPNIEPYIISAIDERNIVCLACRVSADETALDYMKKFYTAEKLSTYNVAFQEFRDLWFEGKVSWKGYQLTSGAREWLDQHPCKKSEGKCVKIKSKRMMDPLFCFKSSYEELLEEVLHVELYPTIVI